MGAAAVRRHQRISQNKLAYFGSRRDSSQEVLRNTGSCSPAFACNLQTWNETSGLLRFLLHTCKLSCFTNHLKGNRTTVYSCVSDGNNVYMEKCVTNELTFLKYALLASPLDVPVHQRLLCILVDPKTLVLSYTLHRRHFLHYYQNLCCHCLDSICLLIILVQVQQG